MGMYDYVRCEYPLPGNPPECFKDECYQTKDLDCTLSTYTIRSDGRLASNVEDLHVTVTLTFYTNNVVASGPGVYTRNGEDAQWIEYRATFVGGQLTTIEETENFREPALKWEPQPWPEISEEEAEQIKQREEESLLGRTMCLWYGGNADGCMATVIAENERQLVMRHEDGAFELVDRWSRDITLFDSYEDAKRDKDERAANWQAQKQAYDDRIKETAKGT
jgi:hypothetical protein